MSIYEPDSWVVMKGEDGHCRVLGGWPGGYLNGSSWRLNSGISFVEGGDSHLYFHGSSGSMYKCNKDSYEVSSGMYNTFNQLLGLGWVMLEENTDWVNREWTL